MREMLMVSIVGAGTLAMRSVFIVGSATLPASLERLMRHAKPAILAALVGGFLVGADGLSLNALVALVVAGIATVRGAGMLTTIAIGVGVAFVLPF